MFGLHLRSRGRAHDEARGLVSVCRYCGQPMIKNRAGKWHVEAGAPGDGVEDAAPPGG
jgi:hypothetical protein